MFLNQKSPIINRKFIICRYILCIVFGVLIGAGGASLYYHFSSSSQDLLSTEYIEDVYLQKTPEGVFCSDVSRLPKARVAQVLDGDTIAIEWNKQRERLRYYGVDTPEKGHSGYGEAAGRNQSLAGECVRLVFDQRVRDKYGRLLAYVFTETGRSIDAQLIMEGWGRAWKRDGRFRDQLVDLEKQAQNSKSKIRNKKAKI